MPARPDDDFSAFQGNEHLFFNLRDPFGLIRDEIESALRGQVPDTEVLSIVVQQPPKFLTLGRKASDSEPMVVTHFAFCLRARVTVLFEDSRKGELLETTLSCLFGNVDEPGQQVFRSRLDLHEDADRQFDADCFRQRFLAFRDDMR
jgi:hypothetical protein